MKNDFLTVDSAVLKHYSTNDNILIAMANYNDSCSELKTTGKSTIWFYSEIVISANKTQNAIITAEKHGSNWIEEVIDLKLDKIFQVNLQ